MINNLFVMKIMYKINNMKKTVLFFLTIFILSDTYSQFGSDTSMLSETEIKQIFTDDIIKNHHINFPIYRAYKYSDKTGSYYLVLTEKFDKIDEQKDTLYTAIKALNFKTENNKLIKKWEFSDAKSKAKNDDTEEFSIWFWTKYCELQDIDGDGQIDPIILYGTSGRNGYEDGKIKICVYHKSQKIDISHQNSVYDNGRNIHINKLFYALPEKLQKHVKEIMKKLENSNHAIFPYGYEKAMNKKAFYIDERHKN